MQKEIRKETILRRKNFLPSLIITSLLLISLISIIYFADPKSSIFIFLFFVNLFTFLFFLTSLIFASSKRGLIISLCLTTFAIFRMFGIGNILNATLLTGLGIIATIYERTTKRNKKHILPNS
ncbi:MAG: hypothetical protein ACD_19C00016G0018 [uncultured bacterium]|nr:MAG: hypothetical protein ACD_19C00016G0018 [uncultured bacterium]